jgi:hypothetical protein
VRADLYFYGANPARLASPKSKRAVMTDTKIRYSKITINETQIYESDGDIHIIYNANKFRITNKELLCYHKFTDKQKLKLEKLILNFVARINMIGED